ncbi:two-component system sensor histidine kinase YesM [Paenibacillus sp. BK033]|uniref:sensor histidine kinase n=1 Tax=Paenibacillus sp. BK033 TaxID=2512133 RepID=UPI00104E2955|nr:histidine kinase [Paenibacillus sp. BK033]TCM89105.1 two-component system sensor histidine kinase YesM [Paenibacillus sp. BK033]
MPFHTRSLVVKLILSLSLIVILTSSITGIIVYRSNQNMFREEIRSQFLQNNKQALQRINQNIHEVERISQSIVFHPTVVKILTNSLNNEDKVEQLQLMYDMVSQAKLDAPHIRAMFIFNLRGDSYYNANYGAVSMLDKPTRSIINQELEGTNGALTWFRLKLVSSADPSGYRYMIIAARQMKSTFQETYGTLVLVLDEGFFSEVIDDIGQDDGIVYLLDRKDRLLFSQRSQDDASAESDYPETIPLQHDREERASIVQSTNRGNYLFVKNTSDSGIFKLISGLGLSALDKRNADILKTIAISGLSSILLTGLLLTLTSTRLLRPLGNLVSGMRRLRSGQMNTRVEVRSKDELAFLGESFNDMADNIQTLVDEVLLKQLREKEAELRAIQAQLNPHFLYNILNEIYWKLYLQNAKDTAGIIQSLSKILQYSLKPIQQPSTLREELEQLRSYINIQMSLFHPDLELDIRTDEHLLCMEMQRLLLQPAVENVFVHAFADKTKADKKLLRIHVYREQEHLRVDVTDNGKGIEPEMLRKLAAGERDVHGNHLGIHNVERRIQLVYGTPYGLRFESWPDAGTTVSFILPISKEDSV